MKINNCSYANNRVAFGTNKGFLAAANELKKYVNPDDIENLAAHAKSVVKDSEFMAAVNAILKDEKTPPILRKLIKIDLGFK
jgi:hypothetical protein